ncbi:DUF916 and DUF3324 domain-containing protein [Furfurilactobacillus entadae]|uniref:DUF916 and DUF3324 domain-containing protein n=1 Tax=Furfurilactobacillus entadae TaxID=2922307 RepID=UPI0035EAD13D
MSKRTVGSWLTVIIAITVIFFGGVTSGHAADKTNNVGYSVKAELPDNQIHKDNTFYDLKMTPGQEETLKATIYNLTNKDITVSTAIHTAYTNSNGVIEYVKTTKTYDSTLKYKMSDLTKLRGPATVTVPANGHKEVTAQVTMPKDDKFKGVILGGWYFKRTDQTATGNVKGSMNIQNEYSYVIGMKYTVDKEVDPTMAMGSVSAGMTNAHKGVFPTIRNTSARIIPNMTVKSKIINKQTGKTVKTLTKKNVQMAPNSGYRIQMLYNQDTLQPGKYKVDITAKNADHAWHFTKDFTISQQEAKTYNKKDVNNKGISIWWFIIGGALGMLILVLLGIWIFFLIRNRGKKSRKH